jgi:hypothetical protein
VGVVSNDLGVTNAVATVAVGVVVVEERDDIKRAVVIVPLVLA